MTGHYVCDTCGAIEPKDGDAVHNGVHDHGFTTGPDGRWKWADADPLLGRWEWAEGDRVRLVARAWDRVSGGSAARTGTVVATRDHDSRRYVVKHDPVGWREPCVLGWHGSDLEATDSTDEALVAFQRERGPPPFEGSVDAFIARRRAIRGG